MKLTNKNIELDGSMQDKKLVEKFAETENRPKSHIVIAFLLFAVLSVVYVQLSKTKVNNVSDIQQSVSRDYSVATVKACNAIVSTALADWAYEADFKTCAEEVEKPRKSK